MELLVVVGECEDGAVPADGIGLQRTAGITILLRRGRGGRRCELREHAAAVGIEKVPSSSEVWGGLIHFRMDCWSRRKQEGTNCLMWMRTRDIE